VIFFFFGTNKGNLYYGGEQKTRANLVRPAPTKKKQAKGKRGEEKKKERKTP
jgi:hypothetical protein